MRVDKSTKELWRLRINFLFIILVNPLYSISTTGISSSFHQFVTNPRIEDLVSHNGTQTAKMEPGIGESELFYSLLISGFNFGAMVGGITSGFIVKCLPHWQLWLSTLSIHTIGYIIYSVANVGWLVMISKLLSGYFLGAVSTLVYSYISDNCDKYVQLQKEMGLKKTDEMSTIRLRNYLFSLVTIAYSVGFVIGPGIAVVFAQFSSISQFRSIGWFNAACGLTLLIMLIVLFHGESSCTKISQCRHTCQCKDQDSGIGPGPLQIFIVLSLLLLSLVEMLRFGIVETLFNPILSDSFGLNERDSTYIFLGLGIPHLLGSLLLIVLQKAKLSTQAIIFIGMLMTIVGYLLLGDWQTIPYDPCTEYSPFHHPEIAQNNSFIKPSLEDHSNSSYSLDVPTVHVPVLKELHFLSNVQLNFAGGSSVNSQYSLGVDFKCKKVESCLCSQEPLPLNVICLNYTLDNDGNMVLGSTKDLYQHKAFLCTQRLSPVTTCVNIFLPNDFLQTAMPSAHIEQLQVLPESSYWTSRNNCMNANVTNHRCHWIPSSILAKKECEDCQPICRSIHQTLTFAQFCLGLALLMLSNALILVPLVSLLFNQVPQEIQGIMIGFRTLMTSASRTFTPLFLDAAYEGMQKRTYPIMIAVILLHIPFLIEIIVLYKQMGPSAQLRYTKIKNDLSDFESEK